MVKPRNEEYVSARTSFSPKNIIRLGCYFIQIKATNMDFVICALGLDLLSYLSRLICYYADWYYAKCCYAKCHYAQCCYVECSVAPFYTKIVLNYFYAGIQTLDLRKVSQVFDHCATTNLSQFE